MKCVIILLNIFYLLIVSAQNNPFNLNQPFKLNGNSPNGPYITPQLQQLPNGFRAGVEVAKPLYTSPSGNHRLDAFGTYRQDFNNQFKPINPYVGGGLRYNF